MRMRPNSLWVVDVIKAIASQIIVWHHFISYGPLASTLRPHATVLFDWLYHDGRIAVQAFLVAGGFLAARSLIPGSAQLALDSSGAALFRLAWRRYVRLLRPYLIALLLAISFAALARSILHDPDTPAVASLEQLLFHILLIQDIVGVEALSAGVWYVAIDFQLYCLMLLVLWLSQRLAITFRLNFQNFVRFLLVGLSALSVLWFNRNDGWEMWAIYFAGAYGLGVLVQWTYADRSTYPWLVFLLVIYVLALSIEWRSRLAISLTTAFMLWFGLHSKYQPTVNIGKLTAWLSRISYSVFLIHYPVVLLIGSVVAFYWPDHVPMAIVGYLMSWLATLGLAHVLYHRVERPSSS